MVTRILAIVVNSVDVSIVPAFTQVLIDKVVLFFYILLLHPLSNRFIVSIFSICLLIRIVESFYSVERFMDFHTTDKRIIIVQKISILCGSILVDVVFSDIGRLGSLICKAFVVVMRMGRNSFSIVSAIKRYIFVRVIANYNNYIVVERANDDKDSETPLDRIV